MTSKNARILVVDDVEDNIFLLQTFLESQGYQVDVAYSGALGLEKIQVAAPDLVLLDVMMPDMNGYEVTRRIRRDNQLHSIPVVLITAYIESCRIKGLAAGATDFIRKPVQFEEVLLTIQRLLDHQGNKSLHPESSPV